MLKNALLLYCIELAFNSTEVFIANWSPMTFHNFQSRKQLTTTLNITKYLVPPILMACSILTANPGVVSLTLNFNPTLLIIPRKCFARLEVYSKPGHMGLRGAWAYAWLTPSGPPQLAGGGGGGRPGSLSSGWPARLGGFAHLLRHLPLLWKHCFF